MKLQNIRIIIALIIIALMALIAIQIYWIGHAVALRKKEFNDDINNVLVEVSKKLEKIETVNRLRAHRYSKILFSMNGGTEIYQFNKNDTLDNIARIILSDSSIFKKFHQTFHIFNRSGNLYSDKHIKTTLDYNEGKPKLSLGFSVEGFEDISNFYDSLMMLMNRKTDVINDIMNELFEVNFGGNYLERIDQRILDSLLNSELSDKGITSQYKYGIFNSANIMLLGDQKYVNELTKSNYFVRLYPNDILRTPHILKLYFPDYQTYILGKSASVLALSAVIILIIIAFFYYTITTILKQKKLSDIRNDFINNMTHELKTPISTISLACEALNDKDVSKSPEIEKKFTAIIKEETGRLSTMVEKVLQNAILDKSEFKLKQEPIDIHLLLEKAIKNIELQVEQKEGKIISLFEATMHTVIGDELHLYHSFVNIIDNANKYTPVQPEILVTTENLNNTIIIKIKDNGIGISEDDQKRIFEKFYRVPTGNIHNVKGFGLGLHYAYSIITKHKGNIEVYSQLNQGSEFTITLPVSN